MTKAFSHDVFLRHSSKDKAVVQPLAERLQEDGVRVRLDEEQIKPGNSIPAKIEEGLEHSRILALCMSENAFGSDWAQSETGTYRFRDSLNQERRAILIRLETAHINGSLAQVVCVERCPETAALQRLYWAEGVPEARWMTAQWLGQSQPERSFQQAPQGVIRQPSNPFN